MPNRESDALPVSPVELFLPEGYAETAIVLGGACPASLLPSAPAPASEQAPVALAILAPLRAENRDRAWIEEAAESTERRLAADGIAYVLPATASRLRRALESRGLRATDMLLHVPDVGRSRHVVPIGTAASRYALSGHLAMRRGRRLAAAGLVRSQRLAALGPTGVVFRRARSAPLAAWLFDLSQTPKPGSALVSMSGTARGGAVLHRFPPDASLPDAVAKVTPGVLKELDGLRTVAPTAARAGVRVPSVLATGRVGDAPVLLQSALGGQVAADLLARGRLSPGVLQERLASWLGRWGQLSGRQRPIEGFDLERLVLSPAARLLPDEGAYLGYLEELCARASGTSCLFVASHGDLTAANILLDDPAELGVVDWEEASDQELPLMDFFYAAADAVAAVERYADRPGAVRACFAFDAEGVPSARPFANELARSLTLDDVVQEICFHACWLRHAANESARKDASGVGPFGSILRAIAGAPERYRPLTG
jgi:hypothetical protein